MTTQRETWEVSYEVAAHSHTVKDGESEVCIRDKEIEEMLWVFIPAWVKKCEPTTQATSNHIFKASVSESYI